MFEETLDLYNAEVRRHARHPAHAALPPGATAEARGDNPMCGDRITVAIRAEAGRVAQAGFQARGCDIMVASADLMCEAVPGQDAAAIRTLANEVEALARTGACPECDGALATMKPLSAIHDYPSRLRCVTLPWTALLAALEEPHHV